MCVCVWMQCLQRLGKGIGSPAVVSHRVGAENQFGRTLKAILWPLQAYLYTYVHTLTHRNMNTHRHIHVQVHKRTQKPHTQQKDTCDKIVFIVVSYHRKLTYVLPTQNKHTNRFLEQDCFVRCFLRAHFMIRGGIIHRWSQAGPCFPCRPQAMVADGPKQLFLWGLGFPADRQ